MEWQEGKASYPKNVPAKLKQARERTLGVHVAVGLRNENSSDFSTFKNNLDIFLSTIPDQPTTPGLVRGAAKNSLMIQIPLVYKN